VILLLRNPIDSTCGLITNKQLLLASVPPWLRWRFPRAWPSPRSTMLANFQDPLPRQMAPMMFSCRDAAYGRSYIAQLHVHLSVKTFGHALNHTARLATILLLAATGSRNPISRFAEAVIQQANASAQKP